MFWLTHTHSDLYQDDWSYVEIKTFLERDSSSINEVNSTRETPLLCMLKKRNCTVEVIHLLLEFGADVNCKDRQGRNSLTTALEYSRNEDIIEALLEKGVNVSNALCLAFYYGASKGVVELLLNAGYSCGSHGSILHCAFTLPMSGGLKRDVFQMLLERGADLRAEVYDAEMDPRSVMCSALGNGNRASVIRLLMDAGVSLDECTTHSSPLFCAIHRTFKGDPLRADTVELLLQSGACLDKRSPEGDTPLCSALARGSYETEAIRLLLGVLHGIDPKERYDYLYVSMFNPYCTPTVVRLLIEQGLEVDAVNRRRQSALHMAAARHRDESVIKVLVESGADVNLKDVYGSTPLMMVMHQTYVDTGILNVLLNAGASIKIAGVCNLARVLKYKTFSCIKLLLKHFFLQNMSFEIACVFLQAKDIERLLPFREECETELLEMKSNKIGEDFTLYEFLNEYSSVSTLCDVSGKKYDFRQLLKTVADNAYPIYFETISARIGKKTMIKMLAEVKVYTVRTGDKIVLNYDSVCHIAQFMDEKDLLRFIQAFYNPYINSCMGQARNMKIHNCKRNGECIFHRRKKPKFQ